MLLYMTLQHLLNVQYMQIKWQIKKKSIYLPTHPSIFYLKKKTGVVWLLLRSDKVSDIRE
jgi:hypothetical protein